MGTSIVVVGVGEGVVTWGVIGIWVVTVVAITVVVEGVINGVT